MNIIRKIINKIYGINVDVTNDVYIPPSDIFKSDIPKPDIDQPLSKKIRYLKKKKCQ